MTRFTFQQGNEFHSPPMVSKMVGIRIRRGERLRLETPGGGGYGPVAERDPLKLERDLRLGYVSADGAARYRQAAE